MFLKRNLIAGEKEVIISELTVFDGLFSCQLRKESLCPEWQNDCCEIHLMKEEAVKADVNMSDYVSSINSQLYLFRVLCSEIRRCYAPFVMFDEYTL